MNDELKGRLAALSPEQIKSLFKRHAGRLDNAPAPVRRVARSHGQPHPLSSAQERLWFLAQLSPDSRALNNPGALRARTAAPLKRELFERSLNEVARRHEILRTTFHAADGRPVQIVHDEIKLSVGWEDLSALAPEEREKEAARIAVAEGLQEFDLAHGPLVAMKILRLGELEYVLLITSHHIVSDGWSMAMFSTEVASIYNMLDAGHAPYLPEPEYQYVDYVYWDRERAADGTLDAHVSYWKEQLADAPEPLRLPTDRPRPPVSTGEGSIAKLKLAPELAARLKEFARAEGATLFMILVAALKALLHRYTGQEDIVIGTSTANRTRREFEGVMGLFINTLALRTRVSGDGSFRDYLREVREACLGAYSHQELPFERLVQELQPERTLNAHPIFQVMFMLQNVPALYIVPGMRLELMKVDYGTSKFDLNLWVEELNNELLLTLHYSRDLFDAPTAARILSHYRTVLESAVAAPDLPIKHLEYFPPEERDFVLRSRDAATEATRADATFAQSFEAQVEQTPDAVAVEDAEELLTYRELNTRANRLAHRLRSLGVGEESIVALLCERGVRALVGMIGVMKAGAAYLPLDPSHPRERVELMLRDSGACALLTEERQRTTAEPLSDWATFVEAIYLDDAEEFARESDENLWGATHADGLAYVIYTSGSTGVPKGVCVEQRNLVNYCDAAWSAMKLAAGDRFAIVSSLAADLANTMIFPALANGGCVVLVQQEAATDARLLAAEFEREPVDCLKIVPSHLRALLDSDRALNVLPRKLLVLGGEAASPELLARVRETGARCRVINHYGPTECTVGALTYEVGGAGNDGASGASLPVGFPLAGCSAYVLDAEMQPVAVGVAGELYLGGACVTRGYLYRGDATAERFVPDPFATAPGSRLYRTGDRAGMLAGGAIEFLGRVDRQIKIRGYRVELPEIECALQRCAGVAEAVVLAPEDDDPAQRLIAYVQPTNGASLDAASLKDELRQFLPHYMIPSSFVFLNAMPLTANGKIDHRALPRVTNDVSAESFIAPRDRVELELARIWQELLGVERVGVGDNFFDLGGHSLIAVQLIARVNAKFDRELPLSTLFESGTVEGMAQLIRRDRRAARRTPLVPIREGAGQQLFFVHPAGGNVLCYYELANSLSDDLAFYGLQAAPNDNGARQSDSIAALARHYLDAMREPIFELRSIFPGDEPPVFGGWSMGALVAFEMARLYARERGSFPTVAVLDQAAPRAKSAGGEGAGGRSADVDDELSRLVAFAGKASQFAGSDLGITRDALAGADETQRSSLFLEKFKAARLVPEETEVEDFQSFLAMMLAHNDAASRYEPGIYGGRVVVLRAEEPLALGSESKEARGIEDGRESDLGWQRYASQPVEVVSVPGSHVTMMTSPNVQALAEKIARRVAMKEQLA